LPSEKYRNTQKKIQFHQPISITNHKTEHWELNNFKKYGSAYRKNIQIQIQKFKFSKF